MFRALKLLLAELSLALLKSQQSIPDRAQEPLTAVYSGAQSHMKLDTELRASLD